MVWHFCSQQAYSTVIFKAWNSPYKSHKSYKLSYKSGKQAYTFKNHILYLNDI